MNVLSPKVLCLVVAGCLLAAYAMTAAEPDKPVAEPVSDKEKASLRGLHYNAVDIFVDRPGFGMRRMVLNLNDLVTGPKSLAERNAKSRLPDPKGQKVPSHYAVQDVLIERAGRFPTDDGQETWQLRKVHLVGLLKHDDPVVYLTDPNPKKRDDAPKAEKDIPTRAVNEFEKVALAAIRNGEPLLAEKGGKNLKLLAPIFAGKRCATCHDQGALLGGFTYEFDRVAHDPKKDGARGR